MTSLAAVAIRHQPPAQKEAKEFDGRVLATQSDELVFTASGAKATRVDQIAIEDLGLTERGHLQEWVITYPAIIGPGVLIITFEFDQWIAANGATRRDRLDVLGLHRDGRLVIAKLTRGLTPNTVELQAIKYAAYTLSYRLQNRVLEAIDYLEDDEI